MSVTYEKPISPGWYWVCWKGYEFPEVVIVNKRLEVYSAGDNKPVNCNLIARWYTPSVQIPDEFK